MSGEATRLRERVAELQAHNADLSRQVEELTVQCAQLRGQAFVAGSVLAEIRAITAERATWETEALRIKDKWERKLAAAVQELRMSQRGLSSGCGCPIGECLQPASSGAACWMQWCLSKALVTAAQQHMDNLRAQAVHPRRMNGQLPKA